MLLFCQFLEAQFPLFLINAKMRREKQTVTYEKQMLLASRTMLFDLFPQKRETEGGKSQTKPTKHAPTYAFILF